MANARAGPATGTGKGKLLTRKLRDDLQNWLAKKDGLVAEFAIAELNEIAELSDKITELTRRITTHVEAIAPSLLALPGCGSLSAAKIIGESADVTRFPNESAFARSAGVGPIPMWSGSTAGAMRSRRTGNRQVNAALHLEVFDGLGSARRLRAIFSLSCASVRLGDPYGWCNRTLKNFLQ
jgi:transposase